MKIKVVKKSAAAQVDIICPWIIELPADKPRS